MAKESNGKIISLLKEVLAKVGGGSGDIQPPEQGVSDTTITVERTGQGECRIHQYGSSYPTVTIDGIDLTTITMFRTLDGTSSNYEYCFPFNKSIKIVGSKIRYFIIYK